MSWIPAFARLAEARAKRAGMTTRLAMKVTIKGTNIELSDSVYQYINDKIGSLDKFVKNVSPVECWVEVERTTKHHRSGDIFRAEAQIKLPGSQGVRAESTQWDLHQAIDEAKNDMQQQLKKYKGKMISARR
jgi:ribosomal subunit interface protein